MTNTLECRLSELVSMPMNLECYRTLEVTAPFDCLQDLWDGYARHIRQCDFEDSVRRFLAPRSRTARPSLSLCIPENTRSAAEHVGHYPSAADSAVTGTVPKSKPKLAVSIPENDLPAPEFVTYYGMKPRLEIEIPENAAPAPELVAHYPRVEGMRSPCTGRWTSLPVAPADVRAMEAAKGFECEDDEVFCPGHLLTREDMACLGGSKGSGALPRVSEVLEELERRAERRARGEIVDGSWRCA